MKRACILVLLWAACTAPLRAGELRVGAAAVDMESDAVRKLASSMNVPLVIVRGISDRADEPHEASLFDIDAKYGDVVPVDEVLEYLGKLRSPSR